MPRTVQTRLDEETEAVLDGLVERLRLNPSEVLREGIRVLHEKHNDKPRKRLIGVGMFSSGIPDLATNKKHMEGFGEKSMGRPAKRARKGRNR